MESARASKRRYTNLHKRNIEVHPQIDKPRAEISFVVEKKKK